ncbi:hypothetical protein BDV93DRAFT_606296 [Ceratobasidium sp. AG-I]|nr:hypothetical protein BDV93DRAFT_606296 [Ceratobasidium sp. AG-I]
MLKVPEKDPLRERINGLLSAPTNPETAEQLAELKLTLPTDGKLICLLAEAPVPDAITLAHARAQVIPIRPALYEPVVYRLVRRHRWADVLALLEPLQSLAPPTLESHMQKKLTTRLCEWRVKACAELDDFAGMERALGLFPRGISRRSWEVAERACMRNSDPKMAGKIREVLKLVTMVEGEGEGDVKGKGEDRDMERFGMEEIAQALISRPITREDPSSGTHPSHLYEFHESTRAIYPTLPTLRVKALVQENRVTEAATIAASMCKDVLVLEPLSGASAPSASSTPGPTSAPLPGISASVRPSIFAFNALLKGILYMRGLTGMISLLEIMQGTDVKPGSATGVILLRHPDQHHACRFGQLIDALVDLTARISSSPAIYVLLSSILNAQRKATLGEGQTVKSVFPKYRTRPVDRCPPYDARLASLADGIDPLTAGLPLRACVTALKPVLKARRSRRVRNDGMAYYLCLQRNGVVRLDPEMARTGLERTETPGLFECGVDSPVMYTILIAGYACMGQPHDAQRVFEEVYKDGVKPDATRHRCARGAWFVSGEYRPERAVEGDDD